MQKSKCPACRHSEFEAVPVVNKTGQSFCLIQCVACGTVVGAIDDVKVASVVRKAEKKLNQFLKKLGSPVAALRKKESKEELNG